MGAKSTVDISREEALREIRRFLEHASDMTLGEVLEVLNDGAFMYPLGLHNFNVTEGK